MATSAKDDQQKLKRLKAELKALEAALAATQKREGHDPYITVKVKKSQGRFERQKKTDGTDTALGKYYLEIMVTAKARPIYIPISLATGKKTAGFMYQIEGTAESALSATEIEVRGEAVTHIVLGTLRFALVPVNETALFRIHVTLRGKFGKKYKFVINRLNYKLDLTDHRYEYYLKPIHSDQVTFA